MEKQGFGDRIKDLELAEAGRAAMPRLSVLARLDGRAFHSLTKKFDRPFDADMASCMVETTKALIEEFDPVCAYTQSDEITLAWLEPCVFDGRFQKLTSVLASYASAVFGPMLRNTKAQLPKQVPCFDCRVWQVPSFQDVIDVFVWREDDATKNSITMAAQKHYSHKQLMGVNSAQKHELLHVKGVNWNDYPPQFKRGVYLKCIVIERCLTPEEIRSLPEKARPKVASSIVRRNLIAELDMPPIRKYSDATRVLLGVDLPTDDRFERADVRYEVTKASPIEYRRRATTLKKLKAQKS